MTPRSGHNKTAPPAFLHGSMFSKPCAPAQGRVPCTRAAAQAAALRLLYHDAAKRPQQNRTCCGFAWFNVPKALCISAGACALHTRSRVNGSFGGYYTIKIRVCTGGNMQCPPPWRSVRGAFGQDGKKEKICVKYYQLYRKMAV